ncbi:MULTISPECIES: Sec-independent protein translocase subunit TatA/TatB [Aquirufa]|jgi:sec-independent protein translocase protein TatA|uniref:Sec-independent protein translocase protein TatA n=3 Tax=Aquirufa TaxID=2676247 RepID=A0ABU3TR24_9BACT|nr:MULTISPECIES: twin-arginine translocase TatA/TatE family subunit [unclassified Aquirufa]MBP6054265.1 twin-arginine translocase TatA/TatE family subunit [Cytophagaceae bacterium]MBP6093924.1 twin-arginine translocase TatA/TatE family subunit [Cytophagaceae bacterium]MDT8886710.1 twin-arginine translocase TatA/TatE family subunit [Aquirufa sp. LEPPI-3A]MDU0808325.1 twin-arginine translocase TatA/TatE family subunit [Aquirufa sp. LEOWEIH-7C]
MNISSILLFLNGLGGGELLLIGLAILLFFGGKKLPELMRGLGKGIREFQDAKNEVKDQINKELDETKK